MEFLTEGLATAMLWVNTVSALTGKVFLFSLSTISEGMSSEARKKGAPLNQLDLLTQPLGSIRTTSSMYPPPLQALFLSCKITQPSFGTPHLCMAMESSIGSCAQSGSAASRYWCPTASSWQLLRATQLESSPESLHHLYWNWSRLILLGLLQIKQLAWASEWKAVSCLGGRISRIFPMLLKSTQSCQGSLSWSGCLGGCPLLLYRFIVIPS